LHFEQESVERAIHPDDFVAFEFFRLASLRAAVERHDLVALEAAAYALALELGNDGREIDDEQVLGTAVQGCRELRRALPRAHEQRFVVAGDEPGLRTLAAGHSHDAIWGEMLLQERAHEVRVAGARRHDRGTKWLPLGPGMNRAAGSDERRPECQRIVRAPAG
jgi:hypothetical protein